MATRTPVAGAYCTRPGPNVQRTPPKEITDRLGHSLGIQNSQEQLQLLYLFHNMVSSTVPRPCLILCSFPIPSPAAMLHFSALAFLRGPSPKLGPNLWALTGGHSPNSA